ncbi:hypothetical protein SDC9_42887 [bioreactor metagenome]|uniref:HTH araC/xylS-type domain-containing protein n=1 Tax=bioreactor metagenome TaxID=1076179 RepID=A0A644VZ00_9ZZZZ|nr:helix-turn-helix domain-containing protein [Paludibacter sp.]
MVYNFFSIMPIFVALFWVVTLLIDRNKNNSKRFLAFFLSLSVFNYFAHWLYFNHQYSFYIVFDGLWIFTSLAGYPLYYYYIRLLTTDTKINLRWSWLILPATLLSVFSIVVYQFMSPQEKEIFIQGILYHHPGYSPPFSTLIQLQMLRLAFFKIIFAIQVVLSVFFGLKLIKAYNLEIKRFYSQTHKKDLRQIKWLLIFFILAAFISFTSNTIGKDYFAENNWLLAIPSAMHSLYLFGIGYVGSRLDFTIEHFQHDIDEAETMKSSKIPMIPYNQVKKNLIKLLEEDKIYANPELRISDVTFLLNTNRTYVSKVINEEFKTNFSDLINSYRIAYSKEMLSDVSIKSLTLSQIAENAGFSNNSTFYRIFKEKEGISPGDYRKRHVKFT